mgnify:CR=1 FL=1
MGSEMCIRDSLLRVLSIRSDGSLVVDTVTPAALKTLLEAT